MHYSLPQPHIGSIKVVGECQCFGLATIHDSKTRTTVPIYLSIAGPTTTIDSVWATLNRNKNVTITFTNNEQLTFTMPKKQKIIRHKKRIDGLAIEHAILLHEDIDPDDSTTKPGNQTKKEPPTHAYVLVADEEQGHAKAINHITNAVKLPIFPSWHPYLIKHGIQNGLIRSCKSHHGTPPIWQIMLNEQKWTALIQAALRKSALLLPTPINP